MSSQSQEFYRRYKNVKQRHEGSEKVIQEMKKSLMGYKEEIESMKTLEGHATAETYQKLVTDFNQLFQ